MPARPRPSRCPRPASARTLRWRLVRGRPERVRDRRGLVATIRSGSPRAVRVAPVVPFNRVCPGPTPPRWAVRGPTPPRWAGHAPIPRRCRPSVLDVRVSAPVDRADRPARAVPVGPAAGRVRDRAPPVVRPAEASGVVRLAAAVTAVVPEVRVALRAALAPATAAVVPAGPGRAVDRTAVARAPAHPAVVSVGRVAVRVVAAGAAAPVAPSAGAAASRGAASPSARSGRSSTTSPRRR